MKERVICRRRACRRYGPEVVVNGGLCDDHRRELAHVGPELFKWKRGVDRIKFRNELGQQAPTELDDELIDKIAELVTATGLKVDGASYAGIPRRTFMHLMSEGRKPDGRPECQRLVAAIDDAISRFAVARVGRVAAADDWRADAWLLEHHPETKHAFGAVVRREIANADGAPFQTQTVHTLDLSKLSLEQKRQMAELLREAGSDDVIDGEVVELPQLAGGDG